MAAPRILEPRDKSALVLDEDHLPLLLSFAKRAAGKWREVGAYLKFEDAILNKIETSISTGGPVACFTELLTLWLKRAPPKFSLPTLEALLEALREDDVGEERVAYNLEQELTKKSSATVVHGYLQPQPPPPTGDYTAAVQQADSTVLVPFPGLSQSMPESSNTHQAAVSPPTSEPQLPSTPSPTAATEILHTIVPDLISTKPQENERLVNPQGSGKMSQAIISDLIAAQVKS